MADTLTVVNQTAGAVCPGGQIIDPGSTVEVSDTPEIRELLDTGALTAAKTGRKAKTTPTTED